MLTDPTALSGGAGALVAGAAFFVAQVLYAPTTFSQMRTWFSGSPTGNVDMGIYDASGGQAAPGNLLAHTGAIAATTGVFTQNLTANITLSPGQYWLAILCTIANSIPVRSTNAAGMGVYARTTSTSLTVLPNTAGTVSTSGSAFAVEALVLNGFS